MPPRDGTSWPAQRPRARRPARTLVAVAGIVIGGTMTAVTLTCRRLAGGIHRRRDEIEAWLSIGATQRQALRDITRYAIVEAAVPGLDTTRTVGLVTLPGAVAGALRRPGLARADRAHIALPSLPAANDVRTYSALGKRYMTTTTQCAITVVKHGNALFDLARWRRA